jgi:hypothetical protein
MPYVLSDGIQPGTNLLSRFSAKIELRNMSESSSGDERKSTMTKASSIFNMDFKSNPKNNFNLDAFYSTPAFVHKLTSLSEEILEKEADEQKNFLLSGLS